MTNSYILIAYKPDSSDYCRGCHMVSYSSDFRSFSDSTKEEIITEWAMLASKELECNESGYKFQLFINGKFGMGDLYRDYGSLYEYDEKAHEDEYIEIITAVAAKVKEIEAERAALKAKICQREQEKQIARHREEDLKQLAALKARYE